MKIIKVKNPEEGIEVCKKLLYEMVSKTSVLFLSGGSTPKTLYEILAKEKRLNAGAVAMVDERFGEKQHENSNELMIKNTHLLSYLQKMNTNFYPILQGENLENTAMQYDETARFLFSYFQKSIAILGVGVDGHMAGIPAQDQTAELRAQTKTDLATSFDNFPGDFKQRITLTFLGLAKLDRTIVLVFGKDKKKALNLMFQNGLISQTPARFLVQKEIAEKVILITDQTIK
jgi:glucosamine-6-phosphate deaminase